MGKSPAFQLFASDFYMDTACWTCSEVGAYTRLLFYQWVNGYIPGKISDMARIVKTDPRTMHKMWSARVENKFELNEENLLVNPRLEKERQKQLNYRESQSKKGSLGAEARWSKGMAAAKPKLIPKNSSSSSSSIKEYTTTVKGNGKFPDEDYVKVQEAYCRLRGVELAPKEFGRIRRAIKDMFESGRTPDQIIGCIEWLEKKSGYSEWSINTVASKMPDYAAGKLKGMKKNGDIRRLIEESETGGVN